MDKKQFALVLASTVVMFWVGTGLSPLLPIYALQLGATPALTGYYLAFSSLTISIGGLAGGWLSDRTGRRRAWMLLANVIAPACLVGMGQTHSFWLLVALTGLLWFTGGVAISLSLVTVGLRAAVEERGRLFGILAVGTPLGALLGGATLGPAADQWGYPAMLRLTATLYVLSIALLVLLRDPMTPHRRAAQTGASATPGLGRGFYLLLLASVVGAGGNNLVNLTRSLAMHSAAFTATAIASTGVAAGLVSLPLSPLAGWLSDRLGRKRLIMICFLAALVGRCAFIPASLLWHFWVAVGLTSILGISGPVMNAWLSDLAPRESLGRALSLMSASGFIGGVLGYGLAGLAIEGLGVAGTFAATAASMLVAIGLLLAVRMGAARASEPTSR